MEEHHKRINFTTESIRPEFRAFRSIPNETIRRSLSLNNQAFTILGRLSGMLHSASADALWEMHGKRMFELPHPGFNEMHI